MKKTLYFIVMVLAAIGIDITAKYLAPSTSIYGVLLTIFFGALAAYALFSMLRKAKSSKSFSREQNV